MARRRKHSDARIYLKDECARIGSGERGVTIITIGSKWVKFRETATDIPGRLPVEIWERRVRT